MNLNRERKAWTACVENTAVTIIAAVPPAVPAIVIPGASAQPTPVLLPVVTGTSSVSSVPAHEQSELWMIDALKGTVQDRIQTKLLPHPWCDHGTPNDDICGYAFLNIVTEVGDDLLSITDDASNTHTAPAQLATNL
ncbi:hypothetical protein EDD21DRAFT_359844 [Dissophora ornata]|nr:hypothetical protein EDD21DRAFT_359844 [Dissophora ornata]